MQRLLEQCVRNYEAGGEGETLSHRYIVTSLKLAETSFSSRVGSAAIHESRFTALPSPNLFSESEGTDAEKKHGHNRHDREGRPVFEKVGAAQNDRAHEIDEIGRGKNRADGIEDPGHGFTGENETGEKNARHDEGHRHLECLHLILRLCGNKEPKAEQGKDVNEGGK